ncbi:Pyrimidodiazepine synthase [Psilocybe cubensis]|uniref:GST N-terminal domain-containing protein n=2 Tax=Psilocybe cubensis TaxID=181762 RepID=A0A8H8CHL7_PSICU|nr:Pyrimidodiazepine synthase [Psilocybe cubensis]KAH9474703.1 Pyrimidodiazepine synthase [Psilocybe cubensis]
MAKRITLYSAKVCPWAHRTELALKESKLPYTRYEIDLANKPEWYAPKINKASKVPAIAYGGPDVPPDEPSPDSTKIAESGVLLEFFADLDTPQPLLPKDPIDRAKARFFIETVTPAYTSGFFAAISGSKDPEAIFDGIEVIQNLLPEKGFAVGEWSIADAAVTPFFARTEVTLKNDIGKYEAGKGKAAWEKLQTDPRYARFRQYFSDLKNRDSYKETFDEEHVREFFSKRFVRDA